MSMRTKIISIVLLAAVALATRRFVSPTAAVKLATASESVAESAAIIRPPVNSPEAVAASVPSLRNDPLQSGVAAALPSERLDDPIALTERTLVGTKWEREGFGLEFGAAGRLLIGGRERAKWIVEGRRVRLYRDTTGEEHWLEIVGDKLMWNGHEIRRVP
jgi:hypothetical protein